MFLRGEKHLISFFDLNTKVGLIFFFLRYSEMVKGDKILLYK